MDLLERPITLTWAHRVIFTRDAFAPGNEVLARIMSLDAAGRKPKVQIFVEEAVALTNNGFSESIGDYFIDQEDRLTLAGPVVVLPGGEACKNDRSQIDFLWGAMNEAGMDRHSYIVAVGGGAFLDLVGFAAATAHRGIRLVRMPTTTLSQGDGGVGVKNGINFFSKKNWVGTFAVPWAVVNDFELLRSLPDRERRAGLIEAVKVALLRDRAFFLALEDRAAQLAALEQDALEFAIRRSAQLHVEHIAGGGDPFELGSARPLDFGHWVAHKIEPASDFQIGHGEAVAIGMAVDLIYANLVGLLDAAICERILALIEQIGFQLYHPEVDRRLPNGELAVWRGLEDFREHLGGVLTITLVTGLGQRVEVHEMNRQTVEAALGILKTRASQTARLITAGPPGVGIDTQGAVEHGGAEPDQFSSNGTRGPDIVSASDAERASGTPLESAQSFLERVASPNGPSPGDDPRLRHTERCRQLDALAAWAERVGLLIPASHFTRTRPNGGGLEHSVFFDWDAGRVVKLTQPGQTGRIPQRRARGEGEKHLRPDLSTPLEYLRRLQLQNDMFGDDYRLEGVTRSPEGWQLVLSQPLLKGTTPTEAEIADFMGALHFKPIAGVPHAWWRAFDGVGAFDAHTHNMVKTARNRLAPIDLQMVRLDGSWRAALGLPPP